MSDFSQLEEALRRLPSRPRMVLVELPCGGPDPGRRGRQAKEPEAPGDGTEDGSGGVRHGPGFATIVWKDGRTYSFGGRLQRAAVAVLWLAYQEGTPDVPEGMILKEIESETQELRQLFRNHPAWGELIQRSSLHGGPVGCYRLV